MMNPLYCTLVSMLLSLLHLLRFLYSISLIPHPLYREYYGDIKVDLKVWIASSFKTSKLTEPPLLFTTSFVLAHTVSFLTASKNSCPSHVKLFGCHSKCDSVVRFSAS